MYKIGDLVFKSCLVYEVQQWKTCCDCAFGYDEEQACLAPFVDCWDVHADAIQFKFIREATDQECLDYADWDVMNKSDDGQLIML